MGLYIEQLTKILGPDAQTQSPAPPRSNCFRFANCVHSDFIDYITQQK